MAQYMKIKCNGPGEHVNEFDLEELKKRVTLTPVMRHTAWPASPQFPNRVVLYCRYCTQGRVVITKDMFDEFLRTQEAKPK